MEIQAVMPRVGENVTSVYIVELVAKIGQVISVGDVLVTVETDKATVEVLAEAAGTLTKILVVLDQEIAPGEPFAVIESGEQ